MGYIPEDRRRHGLLLDAPFVGEPDPRPSDGAAQCARAADRLRAAKADTARIVRGAVRTPSILVTAGSLSGGNQQKLIVGREMVTIPKVLVASPDPGVDVGAQSLYLGSHPSRQDTTGSASCSSVPTSKELIGLSDRSGSSSGGG